MVFVVCGLNHKTSPISIRERLAVSQEAENGQLLELLKLSSVSEGIILSTCNRTEIYCETNDKDSIIPWLAKEHNIAPETLAPFCYLYEGNLAIQHALRVSIGLDSMMLGEPQILGQIKDAYQHAQQVGSLGKTLQNIFQFIFKASKDIRTKSGIGKNPISIAYAAVQLIGKFFPNYPSLNILLIGSGDTATLVAKYLHQQGAHHFMIASRTRENAVNLAKNFSGLSLSITDIPEYLAKADVIISATACPLPFISKGMVMHSLTERKQEPMFFLDLAIPRDIEDDIKTLENVKLYNVDDLQGIIDQGMDERIKASIKAEKLIEVAIQEFESKYRASIATDMICTYRQQMQKLAQPELERAQKNLQKGHCTHQVLSEFSQRLINKLSHAATIGMRKVAIDNQAELLNLVPYLFNLTEVAHEEIT